MKDQRVQLLRARKRYQAIKNFYLSRGRTEQQWQAVSADHHKFNQVWRKMLRLPAGDLPPPEAYRR